MALVPLLVLLSGAASAWGCAFPSGACAKAVCDSHSLGAFTPLLDKSLFFANDTYTKTSFASVPNTLGYYFNTYNTLYNKGRYNKVLKADRDGAPSLNYFELRSTMGKLAKTGVALSRCCNLCASTVGCSLWLYNPYVRVLRSGGVNTKVFLTTGDCYFLLQSERGETWTYDKVNSLCSSDAPVFTDSTVKPYFYGGLCNSQISDDPHFVGAHGTRFDFNGQLDKSFCLMSDSRLHINALLRGYSAPGSGEQGIRSWMKELGFVWADEAGHKHTLRLVARSGKQQERGAGFLAKVELDGEALEVPSEEGASVGKGDMSLTFEGVGKARVFDVDNFQLKIGELLDLHLALRVAHPKLQTPTDAEVHFNMRFDGLKVTENIHGVLGQTYRQTPAQEAKALKYSALSQILGVPVQADGQSGRGFLEGSPEDYATSSIVAADCKFSSLSV